MHELIDVEIYIGIKEVLACQFTLPVLVVTADIPTWIAAVCILADVVRNVSYNKLRFWQSVPLEVLEMVIVNGMLAAPGLLCFL